jgi:hypothetical protein
MLQPEDRTSATLSVPRPTTDADLLDLTERYLGVRFSRTSVVPGHAAPAQAFCDAYFGRAPVCIWKAARGLGGKSFQLAALSWMESLTLQANVSVLGGSGVQSRRVHDYMRSFWMRPGVPSAALTRDASRTETHLIWGNIVEVQNASPTSVRGFHGARLRIDEADEVEWSVIDAARGQAMEQRGVPSNVVFSSTHQNADGSMTRLLREAAERGWPVYEWSWHENMQPHGWLSEQAKERYRQTVSAELWRVEVELGEPSPEGRAILPESIEAMFALPWGEIPGGQEFRDMEGEYFEFEEPVPGATYGTGADWGKQDETVIWTWRSDVHPMRMVAYEHLQRKPMPWMIERLMERMRRYPGQGYHDATGVGTYHADQFTEPVDNYVMVGKARNDLFMAYITAVERGDVLAPRAVSAYHAHKYCRTRDLFTEREAADANAISKAGKGHPPDPFVAAALAYQAALIPGFDIGGAEAKGYDNRGTGLSKPTPAAAMPAARSSRVSLRDALAQRRQ